MSNASLGNVNPEFKIPFFKLLQEYNDRFATSLKTLGKTNSTEMEIKCITDRPVVYNPYRMAIPEKVILREIIDELLDNDIIRESDSPYASPILLVKKRQMTIVCV